jgi:hypothetical protein
MRRPIPRVPSLVLAGSLVGCTLVPQGGMAERCADFMTRAYPSADIDITKSEAAAKSLTTIVATVEGVRAKLPPHARAPRRVAAECRFDDGILTHFRWTKGPT